MDGGRPGDIILALSTPVAACREVFALLARVARQLIQAAFIHRRCRPLARAQLARWRAAAEAIVDPQIRAQALVSLQTKAFHCEGGAVYGACAPHFAPGLIAAIVAIQTLVDCLDNLSDRSGHVAEADLRRMHLAVQDALTPGAPLRPVAAGDDGGYLAALVAQSQAGLAALPGYPAVAEACLHLGGLYAELQVLKHLPDRSARAPLLQRWLQPLAAQHPGWAWWELAAACGSTLALFALLAEAARPGAPRAKELLAAYFPWVAGLHILLDYYVDQAEDLQGGDLNFVRFYPGPSEAAAGLARIQAGAVRRVAALPDPALHLLVVRGLPGLYLSDPKVGQQGLGAGARTILRGAGPLGMGAYLYCRASPPGR